MTDCSEVPNDQPGWFIDPWNSGQLRYRNGRDWTGAVAANPSGPPGADLCAHSVGAPNQQYPLGRRVLHVRALPQRADIDVACLIEDDQGRQLAAILPLPKDRHLTTATSRFGLLDPRGMPMGFFTVGGAGAHDVVGVTDVSGRVVGQLRRTNNFWQRLRSSAMDMTLESGDRRVGRTRVSISPTARFNTVDEPIYDAAGAVLGTVTRNWRYVDTSVTFYDYSLVCEQPTISPLPELILATVFSHYLYDRRKVGGPFASHTSFP